MNTLAQAAASSSEGDHTPFAIGDDENWQPIFHPAVLSMEQGWYVTVFTEQQWMHALSENLSAAELCEYAGVDEQFSKHCHRLYRQGIVDPEVWHSSYAAGKKPWAERPMTPYDEARYSGLLPLPLATERGGFETLVDESSATR